MRVGAVVDRLPLYLPKTRSAAKSELFTGVSKGQRIAEWLQASDLSAGRTRGKSWSRLAAIFADLGCLPVGRYPFSVREPHFKPLSARNAHVVRNGGAVPRPRVVQLLTP